MCPLKPCGSFRQVQATPHKKADKLAIHANFNLPYHDREDFLLAELKASVPFPRAFLLSQSLIYSR